MRTFYTSEKNVQMLISLMKAHGIRKVIASPGTTNITFVASIQNDPWFDIVSAADERSASYIACGMAAEGKMAVAITCTGATASRNYMPGLTEAYYRKLPILAITSTQHSGRIGQLTPQVIDRSVIPNDIAVESVHIPLIHTEEDEWNCNVKLNTALLALFRHGGGPVHINLETNYDREFTVKKLPQYRVINRISVLDDPLCINSLPAICAKEVAIFVGNHMVWDKELENVVDLFCEKYNGAVFCDNSSNYQGKYKIQYNLVAAQKYKTHTRFPELAIDIGEISGAYMNFHPKEVWRVSRDGEIRDRFRKLTKVFEMREVVFFKSYLKTETEADTSFYIECLNEYNSIYSHIREDMLPFSNIWVAYETSRKIPAGSYIHFGILNSLRAWNFFGVPATVNSFSNTGGFGIDGAVSTVLGAALINPDKIHFLVVGDLAFFYDLNAIANRNVISNIRILLINNGCGTEFKNYNHFAAKFGSDADPFIAAKGHYGNKSRDLIKHYSVDLGFEYICASTKEEYRDRLSEFIDPMKKDKPVLFEVFTSDIDESNALKYMNELVEDPQTASEMAKKIAKTVLGDQGVKTLKKILRD